jgi:hypothetical protein
MAVVRNLDEIREMCESSNRQIILPLKAGELSRNLVISGKYLSIIMASKDLRVCHPDLFGIISMP